MKNVLRYQELQQFFRPKSCGLKESGIGFCSADCPGPKGIAVRLLPVNERLYDIYLPFVLKPDWLFFCLPHKRNKKPPRVKKPGNPSRKAYPTWARMTRLSHHPWTSQRTQRSQDSRFGLKLALWF